MEKIQSVMVEYNVPEGWLIVNDNHSKKLWQVYMGRPPETDLSLYVVSLLEVMKGKSNFSMHEKVEIRK